MRRARTRLRRWIVIAELCTPMAVTFARPGMIHAAEGADPQEIKARALFHAGLAQAGSGLWAEAERSFAEADALVPRANNAYNRAIALQHLGRWRELRIEVGRFLARSDPKADAEDRAYLESLEHEATSHLGSIAVAVEPAGARVTLDGVVLEGEERDATFVEPGRHLVLAEAPGFVPQRHEVTVREGQRAQVTVGLEATRPAALRGPPRLHATEGAQPVTRPQGAWVPYALLGAAGAAFIGAGITGGMALGLDRRIASRCAGNVCPPELASDQERMESLATTADVFLAVGVVAGAAGAIWLLTAPGGRGARGPSVSISGCRVSVNAHF